MPYHLLTLHLLTVTGCCRMLGIGCHHAAMEARDREIVEDLFRASDLMVSSFCLFLFTRSMFPAHTSLRSSMHTMPHAMRHVHWPLCNAFWVNVPSERPSVLTSVQHVCWAAGQCVFVCLPTTNGRHMDPSLCSSTVLCSCCAGKHLLGALFVLRCRYCAQPPHWHRV